MKRSTERFLTTHTGSLPRPADLVRMMFAREEGVPVDRAALAARIRAGVEEIVRKQVEARPGRRQRRRAEQAELRHLRQGSPATGSAGRAIRSRTRTSWSSPTWPGACSAIPAARGARRRPATGPISVRDARRRRPTPEDLTAALGAARPRRGS